MPTFGPDTADPSRGPGHWCNNGWQGTVMKSTNKPRVMALPWVWGGMQVLISRWTGVLVLMRDLFLDRFYVGCYPRGDDRIDGSSILCLGWIDSCCFRCFHSVSLVSYHLVYRNSLALWSGLCPSAKSVSTCGGGSICINWRLKRTMTAWPFVLVWNGIRSQNYSPQPRSICLQSPPWMWWARPPATL